MKNEDRKILIKKWIQKKKQKTIKPYFKRERKKGKSSFKFHDAAIINKGFSCLSGQRCSAWHKLLKCFYLFAVRFWALYWIWLTTEQTAKNIQNRWLFTHRTSSTSYDGSNVIYSYLLLIKLLDKRYLKIFKTRT